MFDEADRERRRVRHEIDAHEDGMRTTTVGTS
jgi:hypothetical protein